MKSDEINIVVLSLIAFHLEAELCVNLESNWIHTGN